MAKVIYATAIYTGGNIYQYYGKFSNGNFFLCFTDWEEYLMELDVDPGENFEESGYEEWQNEHTIRQPEPSESRRLLVEAFDWIIGNRPEGNYDPGEIEDARTELLNEIKEKERENHESKTGLCY